jgi:hypothetical protein
MRCGFKTLEEKMDQLNIVLAYEWQPVLLRDKVDYLFPMGVTPFMRARYKEPAVYRWNIFQKTSGDRKLVHIGEAQELCPRRIYGYLNPGPTQQTNKKIKTEFENYMRQSMSIGLDICVIQELTFGETVLGKQALNDKYIRQLIQTAMIIEHRKKGFTVLEV